MLYVYIGCLTFGVLYSLVSAILGSHGFDHGGPDHIGMDGHGGADSADVPSPFNPLVIASAIATFGAVGIIGKFGLGMGELASSVFALSFAAVVGAVVFFGIVKLMYSSQSNSSFSEEDLIGIDAEVITPVPVNGIGEIAYVINGIRYTIPARSLHGESIRKGVFVKINDIKGHTALVTQKMTIEDIDAGMFEMIDPEERRISERNENKSM